MLIFAHRGGKKPENTLETIKYSLDLRIFDGIELDVNITKDDIVVLFHDKSLSHITNGEGNISEKYYSYVCQLDAGYKWPEYRGKGYRIPRLSSALELLKDKNVYIHLDIKHHRAVKPTINLLKRFELNNYRLILDSSSTIIGNMIHEQVKNDQTLNEVDVATSILQSIYYYLFYILKIRFKNRDIVVFYVNSFFSKFITESLVNFFHEQNIKVAIFGKYINETNIDYFKDIGVDICIVDIK